MADGVSGVSSVVCAEVNDDINSTIMIKVMRSNFIGFNPLNRWVMTTLGNMVAKYKGQWRVSAFDDKDTVVAGSVIVMVENIT